MISRVSVCLVATAACVLPTAVWAQDTAPQKDAILNDGINRERILGVLPNYATVDDPTLHIAPLTAKQKWNLAVKETVDPFNFANAFLGAALSQADNGTPKYGGGSRAYGQRYGAAIADLTTQNFFSAGLLACALHQDPRYFRRGSEYPILNRVVYSVSRLVVARQDSGSSAFNASGVFGMALGIAASNLYYPSESRRGSVMAERVTTSLTGGVIGNLTAEFWPDLHTWMLHHRKLFRKG